jgi:hypothetical protein
VSEPTERAIRELISAVVDLAEVVRNLDPGKTRTYASIETALAGARKALSQMRSIP